MMIDLEIVHDETTVLDHFSSGGLLSEMVGPKML